MYLAWPFWLLPVEVEVAVPLDLDIGMGAVVAVVAEWFSRSLRQ